MSVRTNNLLGCCCARTADAAACKPRPVGGAVVGSRSGTIGKTIPPATAAAAAASRGMRPESPIAPEIKQFWRETRSLDKAALALAALPGGKETLPFQAWNL